MLAHPPVGKVVRPEPFLMVAYAACALWSLTHAEPWKAVYWVGAIILTVGIMRMH